jgi:hypothetical protein
MLVGQMRHSYVIKKHVTTNGLSTQLYNDMWQATIGSHLTHILNKLSRSCHVAYKWTYILIEILIHSHIDHLTN